MHSTSAFLHSPSKRLFQIIIEVQISSLEELEFMKAAKNIQMIFLWSQKNSQIKTRQSSLKFARWGDWRASCRAGEKRLEAGWWRQNGLPRLAAAHGASRTDGSQGHSGRGEYRLIILFKNYLMIKALNAFLPISGGHIHVRGPRHDFEWPRLDSALPGLQQAHTDQGTGWS